MKRIIFTILLGLSLNAEAKIHYPRDLACKVDEQTTVTLRSNNGLWSNWANDKMVVELWVERNGTTEIARYVTGNLASQFNRGNNQPNKKYVFVTDSGDEFFVDLQFRAPHGTAVGIDRFNVMSSGLIFEHKQPFLDRSKCEVIYYQKIEL